MAGRNISVTHEALGTTRVMKTCGMMGEVVGKAASVCVLHDCLPRDVYERYWDDLDALLKLPGKARRPTVHDEFTIPDDALALAGPHGPMTGLDPANLQGLVVDDPQATTTGQWTKGEGLKGYVGYGYLYAGNNSQATCRFELQAPAAGMYDVRVAYLPHENRGPRVPVTVETPTQQQTMRINMRERPPLKDDFISVGRCSLQQGDRVVVTIATTDAGGTVHADAAGLFPIE